MQRFLVITLPHWSVTARARLVQDPVLVVARRKGALVVHAASRLARADGAERGMPLAQARAMLRRGAHELEHDPSADHRALHSLARWCHRISPLVQVVHQGDPSAIVVDLTGLERVHRGEDRLLAWLRARMDRARVECTVWTASTQAAACVAGWAAPSGHDGIIKHGDERWRTRACPIESLRIDPGLVDMLHEVNVRTLDDLRQVQRPQVAARFGQRLLDRLDAVQGLVLEPFQPIRCVPDVQAEVVFDGPCPQLEALCRAVQSCTEQVGAQLLERGRGARAFTVRVHCSDLPPRSWTIRCTQPIHTWQSLRPLVWPALQELPLGHGVEQVRVVARSLRRMDAVQGGIHALRAMDEQGALWIDGVRERLGPASVCRPMLQAVRHGAWNQGTLPVDDAAEGINDPGEPCVHGLASEPPCMWPSPESIVPHGHGTSCPIAGPPTKPRHHADAPSRSSPVHGPWPMPPSCFRWRGGAWCVIASQGPQRLAGAWWHDRDPGTRDHWRVLAEASCGDGHGAPQPTFASRAWLSMVRHADGSWWIHGAWT